MTHNERALLLRLATAYATHIESTYSHLPNYTPGELTDDIYALVDTIRNDVHTTTTSVEGTQANQT